MMLATVKPNFHRNAFFFPEFVNNVFGETPQTKAFRPVVNITEKDNSFEIALAAPGFEKENFSIKAEKEILTISAKKETEKVEGEKIVRKEFNYEQFERTFHLGEKINADDISAAYTNGILKVTLAKKEEVKPVVNTISVN